MVCPPDGCMPDALAGIGLRWNPVADVNHDGRVSLLFIVISSLHNRNSR